MDEDENRCGSQSLSTSFFLCSFLSLPVFDIQPPEQSGAAGPLQTCSQPHFRNDFGRKRDGEEKKNREKLGETEGIDRLCGRRYKEEKHWSKRGSDRQEVRNNRATERKLGRQARDEDERCRG